MGKAIRIGKYKLVSGNIYRKKIYVHFNDKSGKKSITFTHEEFQTLRKKWAKVKSMIAGLKKKQSGIKDSSEEDNTNTSSSSESEN